MIELSLLRVFSVRSQMEQSLKLVNPKTLSRQSIELLKDFKAYFAAYEAEIIDFNEFSSFFFQVRHPNLDEKNVEGYKEIIKRIQNIPLDGLECLEIVNSFLKQEVFSEIHRDLDNNVDVAAILGKLTVLNDSLTQIREIGEDMDLEAALTYVDRTNGLPWRLNCLQEHVSNLIKGDLVLVAGYVDSGKTSFCADQISHMAQQLKGDDYILWLNTEGNWEAILSRIYQSTLNCTQKELTEHTKAAIVKYTQKMNGNKNRIKILNYQDKSIQDVENVCKKHAPSLIVFDLLDHLKGFDNFMGQEGNSAERYGQIYQWARMIATKVCPVIAISQLNRNGNDTCYPKMTELSGSGEKKQAAATLMLMLGSEEGNSTERYLSTPKNKMSSNKGWRYKISFDPAKCRFQD